MQRVLILVEGQTEERFVKDILAPAYQERQVFITPTLATTKRVKDGPNFKGGITRFANFEGDMRRLLHGAGDAVVTTLIDYYGLPSDFPGMDSRPGGTGLDRAVHVERALKEHFGSPGNFLPFLSLHEFEALLFCSDECLPVVMNEPGKQADFAAIRRQFDSPEEINEHPETAPSKRIKKMFPSYRKTLHGPMTAKRLGLDAMRLHCPHFAAWLAQLEAFASA